jgi:CheY-like chemotaxis protein
MTDRGAAVAILMADDDPDDRLLARDAFAEARMENRLLFVEDGEEVIEYLNRRGKYRDAERYPMPGLILLDLNMPRRDGREVLAEIKTDPAFKHIPVVVLTTSRAEEDVMRSYRCGGNSYIVKPVTFRELTEVVREIGRYWLGVVDLPQPEPGAA